MNLSEMRVKEFDDLTRRHNEYVVYEKPLAEMNNGKIVVSGSKYIIIAPTAVLDRLEKEAELEKHANDGHQTMLSQLAVADCAPTLSLFIHQRRFITYEYNVSWKVSWSAL